MKGSQLTISLDLEEVVVDGRLFDVGIKATGTWADVGIGPWEHFGNKGIDSRVELDEIEIEVDPLVIEILDDGETKEIRADDALIGDITDEIYNSHESYIYDKLEKESESYGEDEP